MCVYACEIEFDFYLPTLATSITTLCLGEVCFDLVGQHLLPLIDILVIIIIIN